MKDLKHLIYFENLLQEANNELVQQAKAEGEHALGYTCYFVPETLLNLPGCFSSRLRAPNTGSIDVGTYYANRARSARIPRSILERGIEGGYDYLDAALVETCQMMHRGHEHFEILGLVKEKNPQFFHEHDGRAVLRTSLPSITMRGAAARCVLEPLHGPSRHRSVPTRRSARRSRDHSLKFPRHAEIGDLRKAANPVITGYEFHVLQLVSQVCPHKRILPYLKQTLTELQAPQAGPAAVVPRAPGRDRTARSTILRSRKLIEDCGAAVVADRYCWQSARRADRNSRQRRRCASLPAHAAHEPVPALYGRAL